MSQTNENQASNDSERERVEQRKSEIESARIRVIAEGVRKGFKQKKIADFVGMSPGGLSKMLAKARNEIEKYPQYQEIHDADKESLITEYSGDLRHVLIQACKEIRVTRTISTTELVRLTPAEKQAMGDDYDNDDFKDGRFYVVRREVKEVSEMPSVAEITKAYQLLNLKSDDGFGEDDPFDDWSNEAKSLQLLTQRNPNAPSV